MKLFFISDIHGSVFYLKKALAKFERSGAPYLVILGDELYHGARNPLPPEYNPKEAAELLNGYADRILAVRGNCESEVDEMVLNYPVMSTYSILLAESHRFFLTHGHIYHPENLPPLAKGDAFLYGHTHVPKIEQKNGITMINPGSITFPKENSPHTYGVFDGTSFQILNLEDDSVYLEVNL